MEEQLIDDFYIAVRSKSPVTALSVLQELYYSEYYLTYYRLHDRFKTFIYGFTEVNNTIKYEQRTDNAIASFTEECRLNSDRLRRDNDEWDRIAIASKQDSRQRKERKRDSVEAIEGGDQGRELSLEATGGPIEANCSDAPGEVGSVPDSGDEPEASGGGEDSSSDEAREG